MKTLTTLVVGMMLGAVGAAAVGAVQVGPADDATKHALVTVKRAIVAGHKAKDRNALDRLYADDYTAIDSNGILNVSARDMATNQTQSIQISPACCLSEDEVKKLVDEASAQSQSDLTKREVLTLKNLL